MRINKAQQQGAAAIELTLVIPAFIALTLLFFDFSRYFLLQGELNRTGYTLANIVAHRQQYYSDDQGKKEPLQQRQVDELLIIAQRLTQEISLGIAVHQVFRVDPGVTSGYESFSSGSSCQQKSEAKLRQLYQSIDVTSDDPEQALFVVELCQVVTGFSLFAKLSGASDFDRLYTSSLMVER